MNSIDPTLSIGDGYQDGYTDGYQDEMGSPVLRPKRLRLRITPSPPPTVTEVSRPSGSFLNPNPNTNTNRASSNRSSRRKIKASLGDAVLIRYMTGGRDPNIANFEADREFSDRSDVDDNADVEDAELESEDDTCDNVVVEDHIRVETEKPRQTEQVDTTEARATAAATTTTRPILSNTGPLEATTSTALRASSAPLSPRRRISSPVAYQHEVIMEDSDEDQYMTSQSNIQILRKTQDHGAGTADNTDNTDKDEAFTKHLDTEMTEHGPTSSNQILLQPSSSQRETFTPPSTQARQQKEFIGLAQMALARTNMSRENSHNKDLDDKDDNKNEHINGIKDSINVKVLAAPPPPADRVERAERTPLPGSRIERSSSINSRTSHYRPSSYKSDQQIQAAAAAAATSPADQSPTYSFTSPSNNGHTPASLVSASSALTPASYATSDQPSPAYSSPGVIHQHQLSPRRVLTLEHTRPPPLLPNLQMQSPSSYSSSPPNFENLKLSPIATDALAHANRSGAGIANYDKSMPPVTNTTTTLPSIAQYIESREKMEGSPLLPHSAHSTHSSHPSPGLQLPPISAHTSPPPTMGKFSSARGTGDIRDIKRSPVPITSRPPTLPPLQHTRHPLPNEANSHASSNQRSPPTRFSRPPISAASVRGGHSSSGESMFKRHLNILPSIRKVHPQLAPMHPDMQAQVQAQIHQAQDPVKPRPTNTSSSSTSSNQVGHFKCTVEGCTAAPFVTQYLLNSHANVHSDERPHYCSREDCPRSKPGNGFKRKNEMIRHGLVHKSPGYVCPYCPEREHKYPRPDNLLRHVRAHHKDKSKDDVELRQVLAQRPDGPNRGRRRRN